MRTESNLLFIFITGIFFMVVFLLGILALNLPFWIGDLKSCYRMMDHSDFVLNHIHIFFYILLTLFLFGMVLRMLFTGFRELYGAVLRYRYMDRVTIKRFRNISVIDTDRPVSFNLFGRIFISTGLLKGLNRKEKKAVFLHEVGHLKNFDSFKYILVGIFLSVFPDFYRKKLQFLFILSSEINADHFSLKATDRKSLSTALLKIIEENSPYPAWGNMAEARLRAIIGEKINLRKNPVYHGYMAVISLILAVIVLRTCFCGVM
ncbi:M56 family metallopeptidase [Persephonella sp.]